MLKIIKIIPNILYAYQKPLPFFSFFMIPTAAVKEPRYICANKNAGNKQNTVF